MWRNRAYGARGQDRGWFTVSETARVNMFRKRDSVERVQVVLCREVVLVDVGQTTGLIYLF